MAAYSGLWDGHHGEPHALLTNKTGNVDTRMARVAARRNGEAGAFNEIVRTLAAGDETDTALFQTKRVLAVVNLSQGVQGGLRTIETVDVINRATDAADSARVEAAFNLASVPSTYAADLSGNSGGGKLGF